MNARFPILSKKAGAYLVLIVILFVSVVVAAVCRWQKQDLSANIKADFSSAESWRALGGSWQPSHNEVSETSSERGAKLLLLLARPDNVIVDVDLKLQQFNGEAGILFRTQDEEEGVDSLHGYFLGVRPVESEVVLYREDYGRKLLQRIILPYATDYSKWIHLSVRAEHCHFISTVTLSDGSHYSASMDEDRCIEKGHVGLYSSQTLATWRNLKIHRAIPSQQVNEQLSSQSTTAIEPNQQLLEKRMMDSYYAEASNGFDSPEVRPISSFPLYPGEFKNVVVRGMIASTAPLFQIQDGMVSLAILNETSKVLIKQGDYVEARGEVLCHPFWCDFTHAELRPLWSVRPKPPFAVTASQLADGSIRGLSITIEGTLLSSKVTANGFELILSDHEYRFRAIGSQTFRMKLPLLKPGSRIRLYGMATSRVDYALNIYPFAVITENLEVISGPPFWTLSHELWIMFAIMVLFAGSVYAVHRIQMWNIRSLLREREEMALEMHDTLAQSFTGIAYQLQAAIRKKDDVDYILSHLDGALKTVKRSHREVSKAISSLRPQHRDAKEIVESLRTVAERFNVGSGVVIESSFQGRNRILPVSIADAFFRIGQEAISNVFLHSKCQHLKIDMLLTHSIARLTVMDDGVGYQSSEILDGLGLSGMKKRAAKIRADITLQSSSGQGTIVLVEAHLPISNMLQQLFYP
jgi:signal transduction histidine kinase